MSRDSDATPRTMPIGDSWRGRIVAAACFALVLALGLIWRLPASPVEWDFIRCDNDSLFQLHRIARALPQYPSVPAFDAFSHHPRGFRVHWPAPHTFFYASLVRLVGLGDASLADVGRFVSWIPPLLGTAGLVLVALVARFYDRRSRIVWLSVLLAAVSGEVVRPFLFGTIDHHLFAELGVMIAVLGRLERRGWLWFAGIFLLCAMTTEAVLYVSVLLLVLGVAEVAMFSGEARNPVAAIWFLTPALAGLVGWLADRLLEAQPLPLGVWSWEYPTLFQPAWYLALGAALLAARAYLGRERQGPTAVRLLVAAAGIATVAAVILQLSGGLEAIVTRLLGANRIYVAEETSVFRHGFLAADPWYQILAASGIYAVWRFVRSRRDGEAAEASFAWAVVVAGNLLAFAEVRHMYIFAALQIVGFSAAALALGDGLVRLLSRPGGEWMATAVALVLSLPLLASADVTHRAAARSSACAALPLVDDVVPWLRERTPSPGDEDGAAAYGVFAPWTLGHQIHVLAQRAVIIDPFNHSDEQGDWVGDTAERVWLAESSSDFLASLRSLGVRYLVLDNPAEEIVGALRRRGEVPADVYRLEPDGRTTFLPGMSRFVAFRLFMSADDSPDSADLALRYSSRQHEDYTTQSPTGEGTLSVPSLRVYELLEPR